MTFSATKSLSFISSLDKSPKSLFKLFSSPINGASPNLASWVVLFGLLPFAKNPFDLLAAGGTPYCIDYPLAKVLDSHVDTTVLSGSTLTPKPLVKVWFCRLFSILSSWSVFS